MTLQSDAKFEEKLTCGLENGMKNLANFHQSIRKSQNQDFDGIILSKVGNARAQNLRKNYVSWQWRANFLLVTSHQLLFTSYQLLVTNYLSLVTSYQLLVTSDQLLATSLQLLIIGYYYQLSLVASHELLLVTSKQVLVDEIYEISKLFSIALNY